jgi:hypothetical protein
MTKHGAVFGCDSDFGQAAVECKWVGSELRALKEGSGPSRNSPGRVEMKRGRSH